jgi:hypothetical protein
MKGIFIITGDIDIFCSLREKIDTIDNGGALSVLFLSFFLLIAWLRKCQL